MKVLFLTAVLAVVTFLLSACEGQQYQLCPDNVTQVLDLSTCPLPKPACPPCESNATCIKASCNAATNYTCVKEEVAPCKGNNLCEQGEFGESTDCPSKCDDANKCTRDFYSYDLKRCLIEPIRPCCGDNACHAGETYVACPEDCEQALDINIAEYVKRKRISQVEADLSDTPYSYLIVTFAIHNINIYSEEVLDYRKQKGFYYDPFKMRVESVTGRFYEVEYDSDLIDGYLDYTIIPMGQTTQGKLLFIVPDDVAHMRLVAYDKFGSKLDIAEIY